MKNYYKTLKVDPSATPSIIEKAYKELAKEYHPDTAGAEKKSECDRLMKEINEAYEVLHNQVSRSKYDKEMLLGTEQSHKEKSYTKMDDQSVINISLKKYFSGFRKEAYHEIRTYLDQHPQSYNALFALGKMNLSEKYDDVAISYFTDATKLNPALETDFCMLMADYYQNSHKTRWDAKKYLDRAEQLGNRTAELYALRAKIIAFTNCNAEIGGDAWKDCESALRIDRNNGKAIRILREIIKSNIAPTKISGWIYFWGIIVYFFLSPFILIAMLGQGFWKAWLVILVILIIGSIVHSVALIKNEKKRIIAQEEEMFRNALDKIDNG